MLVYTKNERKCNLSLALLYEIYKNVNCYYCNTNYGVYLLNLSSTQRRRRLASLLVSSSSTAFFR